MTSLAPAPVPVQMYTHAGSAGPVVFDMAAFTEALMAMGSFLPPPPPTLGHSVSTLGFQPPSVLLQAPPLLTTFTQGDEDDDPPEQHYAQDDDIPVAPHILTLEQAWAALNERLNNEIADSAESRGHACLLLRDVITSPYTEDFTLHAPHQDLWVPRIDELRDTVQQWSNMGELRTLIQQFETAFVNMVSWLHSEPDPDAYYGDYSARLWAVLA